MVRSTANRVSTITFQPQGIGRLVLRTLLLGGLLAMIPSAAAQEKTDGLFLSVPSPITGAVVNQVEHKLKDALERQQRNIRTVVFDFTPDGQPAATSKAGACIDLQKYIQDLQQGQAFPDRGAITTIAFVRNQATKHTVLPILACAEIIMSSEGAIGDVEAESELTRVAYETAAARKNSPDLIQRMLHPNLVIRKVQTRQGIAYLSAEHLEKRRQQGDIVQVLDTPASLETGSALFSARAARELGLCKGIYETRREAAAALGLPLRSLREDPLVGRTPVPWLVDVSGTVNASKLESLRRRVRGIIRNGGNVIFLRLDCEGGDTAVAAPFVENLNYWQDPKRENPVKFIAYVPPNRSLGAATFLALGCSEIVMASNAALGDFAYLADSPDLEQIREALTSVAQEHGYPPRLFQAAVDRNLTLFKVKSRSNPSVVRLMTPEEFKTADAGWIKEAEITKNNHNETLLKINSQLAEEFDVVLYGDIDSLDELYARFGIQPNQVRRAGDHWLDRVAEFFREPIIQVLLILIGITGLILEVKMPGLGLPGVIAGICFVMFFWAHSFVGQFTMLAILLFLLGLVLLAIEIFVIPGFGVTGISGILLLVTSLALVTLEKMPESSEEWLHLGSTLTTFALSLIGAIAVAIAVASFLPHIPYANRLMLAPPDEDEDGTDSEHAQAAEALAALLGAMGIAETPLRPAGKVRFGDEYLDVVSEGEYIMPGSRVQVVEIEGNRIVVKQV